MKNLKGETVAHPPSVEKKLLNMKPEKVAKPPQWEKVARHPLSGENVAHPLSGENVAHPLSGEMLQGTPSVGQLPIYCYPLPPALLTGGRILLDLLDFVR